ncbi:CAP domain-containing protein [Oceaniglobus roseus]|uniref:CAP domain-containing protein n=1 Tax=Oceaniglobus roseus TaxID=1737570 RepID=UPI0015628D91|nr:CAP domain-containing protein [Kandeliimicrobium roseum]
MSIANQLEIYMASLVNALRDSLGLGRLQLEVHLNSAAEDHSGWMLEADLFQHEGAGGSSPGARMTAAGFDLVAPWGTAENIAVGSLDGDGILTDEVAMLHQALVDSPGHYANLTNPAYTVLGIGIETGTFTSGGQDYQVMMITQDFAHTAGTLDLDPSETTLPGGGGADPGATIAGTAGDDLLRGEPGDDVINGRSGNDTLRGVDGNDSLDGGAGDDDLNGQAGQDLLRGGGGDDTLRGAFHDDTLQGGAGDDLLDGGSLNDLLAGGTGHDRIDGVTGNDILFGQDGNDTLRGGGGADRLSGGAGQDLLAGGDHGDRLSGGTGADTLWGQDGNDTLAGEGGDDVLRGGAGADRFVFATGDGTDRIADFQDDQDTLALDRDLWGGGLGVTAMLETYGRAWGSAGVQLDFDGSRVIVAGIHDIHQLADDILFI